MRPIILPSVSFMAVQIFSKLSHTGRIFGGGGGIKRKMFILIFSAAFFCKISHFKENSGQYHTCT